MAARRRPFDLHRIALEVAEQLLGDAAVRAIAVTGSVARGDAGPGSDVDLWIIGDRGGRERFAHPGAEVTLLWQTPRQAQSDETLLLYEVADAVILHDPDGLLRAIRSRFAERRSQLRAVMVDDTAAVIRDLLQRAKRQTPERAVALLREAMRRAAALRVYLDHGWRVPRWRHFERRLPRGAFARLSTIQALTLSPAGWRGLLRHMRRCAAALQPWHAPRAHYPPALPTADRLLWLSRRGQRAEALLRLRQSLEAIAIGGSHAAEAVELWRRAHGFDAGAPRPADVQHLAARSVRLLQLLDIERSIDPDWQLSSLLRGRFY